MAHAPKKLVHTVPPMFGSTAADRDARVEAEQIARLLRIEVERTAIDKMRGHYTRCTVVTIGSARKGRTGQKIRTRAWRSPASM